MSRDVEPNKRAGAHGLGVAVKFSKLVFDFLTRTEIYRGRVSNPIINISR